MSVHLGMHWRLIIGAILNRRILFGVNAIAAFLVAYGFIAFIARGIGEYIFLLTQFAFFDYEEPLSLFMADYVAIMAIFACLGAMLSKITGPASFNIFSRIRLLGSSLKKEEV